MNIPWNSIKLFGVGALSLGLVAFSNQRNNHKKINEVAVLFTGDQNLFISHETVNKLLIQNSGDTKIEAKEKLVLNKMESALVGNPMIKSAEVYLAVNGKLTAAVEQRTPIARIEGSDRYYLDADGLRMPLSKNYTARVPIVTGNVTENCLPDVYKMIGYINTDSFLQKNVIGIQVLQQGEYQLKMRLADFQVRLGNSENLEWKFNNFKAFYSKASKDHLLNAYAVISLEYSNQVVCTKK